MAYVVHVNLANREINSREEDLGPLRIFVDNKSQLCYDVICEIVMK